MTLAQDSHAENRYYKLLGYYGLFAQNWYYGGSPLGVSGTGTFCTVEQKEYRKSVYIKDLFVKGTVVEAAYDKQTGALTIELGKNCLQVQLSPSVTRTSSWVAVSFKIPACNCKVPSFFTSSTSA